MLGMLLCVLRFAFLAKLFVTEGSKYWCRLSHSFMQGGVHWHAYQDYTVSKPYSYYKQDEWVLLQTDKTFKQPSLHWCDKAS